MRQSFVFTGGGTGGHIYPALAVAEELRRRGHCILYIGTRGKMEERIVPEAGFEIGFVRSGALNRVNLVTRLRSAVQVPLGIWDAWRHLRAWRPRAVFSTGGFVAGPVMAAAFAARIPVVIMEANAAPGAANRWLGRFAARALLAFDSARRWFPASRTEVTGLPVRAEFFQVRPKEDGVFTVLVTGGSQGARTLNRAARESWPILKQAGLPVRMLLQSGPREQAVLAEAFAGSGLEGEVVPFLRNMPEAFAQADMVVARAGAGSVSEIAAAGMASLLVPLPFAADDHQRKNAESLVQAGAARMVIDAEMSGARLSEEIESLWRDREALDRMRSKARQFSRPGAAERAADILEGMQAAKKI